MNTVELHFDCDVLSDLSGDGKAEHQKRISNWTARFPMGKM